MHALWAFLANHPSWVGSIGVVATLVVGVCAAITIFAKTLEQSTRPPERFFIAWDAGGDVHFTDFKRHYWPKGKGEFSVPVHPPTNLTVLEVIQRRGGAGIIVITPAGWEGVRVRITAPSFVRNTTSQYMGSAPYGEKGHRRGAYFDPDILGSEGLILGKSTIFPVYQDPPHANGQHYDAQQIRWEDNGREMFDAGRTTLTERPDLNRAPEELFIQRMDTMPLSPRNSE